MNPMEVYDRCREAAAEQKDPMHKLAIYTALQVFLDSYPAGDGSVRKVVAQECERLNTEIRKGATR